MRKTLDEVLAEAAIRDLQIRYCRAIDRVDFDLLGTCFHPDAFLDYGFFKGGLSDFVAQARASLKTFTSTTHFTGNQLVEVQGQHAWAEHYAVATHRCQADESGPKRDFVTSVRYVDQVELRKDDWRISKRTLLLDWWRMDAVSELGTAPDVPQGGRDRTDLSYSGR